MGRFRVSIASLLLVTAFVGVALAALRAPSVEWASSLFSVALAAILFATLGILYRRGRARAFWVGFALFGAGYLALSLIPDIAAQLATTRLLDRLPPASGGDFRSAVVPWVSINPQPPASPPTQQVVRLWTTNSGQWQYIVATDRDLIQRTGHSLFTLLAGFIGGLIARRFFDRTERERERGRELAGGPP